MKISDLQSDKEMLNLKKYNIEGAIYVLNESGFCRLEADRKNWEERMDSGKEFALNAESGKVIIRVPVRIIETEEIEGCCGSIF